MALLHERSLRGRSKMGWLDSYHTFSFSGFHDPKRMGHGALRVINEDRVIAGAGFGAHQHADMDILTYVISGALAHRDSLGNGSEIRPGEIQRMSAGTGIVHSEMNASDREDVHFLQIWIIPEERGVEPVYQQSAIDDDTVANSFGLIAGPVQAGATVNLISDTKVYLAKLDEGASAEHAFDANRLGFLQVVDGRVSVEGEQLTAGDGLQFSDWENCKVSADTACEVLLFDLSEP